MKISNITLQPIESRYTAARQIGGQSSTQISATTASLPEPAKTLDMHNVSLHEINTLIQAGVEGLLDILPAVPGALVDEGGASSDGNAKVDFIGNIEAHIAFKESIGENVDFLNQILRNIKHLDGMVMPSRIDTQA